MDTYKNIRVVINNDDDENIVQIKQRVQQVIDTVLNLDFIVDDVHYEDGSVIVTLDDITTFITYKEIEELRYVGFTALSLEYKSLTFNSLGSLNDHDQYMKDTLDMYEERAVPIWKIDEDD